MNPTGCKEKNTAENLNKIIWLLQEKSNFGDEVLQETNNKIML